MAILIASANPVGVWGESAAGSTTITWNTESGQRARIYLITTTGGATTETLFDGDPVAGGFSGSKVLPVQFASSYFLVMRQVSNGQTLAALTVTVRDLRADLTAEAARGAALEQRLWPAQAIYDLSVTAGIDTCRVKFKTTQPAIPRIQVDAADSIVTYVRPVSDGMRTEHEVLIGETKPLPMATELWLTIRALGKDALHRWTEAVVKRSFATGKRSARIDFFEIEVADDSDGFGAGEGDFTWSFYAGDSAAGDFLTGPATLVLPISSGDPPYAIDVSLDLPFAPRRMWVQAAAMDDDSIMAGYPMEVASYKGDGSFSHSDSLYDRAQVTRSFPIGQMAHGTVIPIVLSTGPLVIDFTVKARITVTYAPGRSPLIFTLDDWIDGGRVTHVAVAGSMAKLGGKKLAATLDPNLDGKVQGHLLAKDADGTLYRQAVKSWRRKPSDADWVPAAPAVEGTVTAVLTERTRIALFTIDRAGTVLRADLDESDTVAEWRSLGGRFAGTAAALLRDRRIELFTRDAEGVVYHGSADTAGEHDVDWQRIGEGVQSEPIAVALDAQSFAVFALSHRGQVLMRRNRDGRWQSPGWEVIPGVTAIRLGAAGSEGQGIALAVLDRDQQLITLTAQDERDLAAGGWKTEGDLQAWLTRPIAPRPTPKTMLKKPRAKIAAE